MQLYLTKNVIGGRIGNNVTMSTTSALYLLHLPRDVLSAIPSVFDNDGMGNMPDYLNMEGILSDIGDFLFDSLVFIASGGFLFLLLHMAEMGLKKLGQMLSAAATVVKNAVDEMAKALNWFMDWVIDFIIDKFTSMVLQPLNDLKNQMVNWAISIASMIQTASENIENLGISDSKASAPIASEIVECSIFELVSLIGFSLFSILMVSMALTGPFGFLSAILAPALYQIIFQGLAEVFFEVGSIVGNVIDWISSTTMSMLGNDLVAGTVGIMAATLGTIQWIASLMTEATILGEGFSFGPLKGFVLATIGAILAWTSTLISDSYESLKISIIGFGIAIYGVYEIFFNMNNPILSNNQATSILKFIALLEAGISSVELTSSVVRYEG